MLGLRVVTGALALAVLVGPLAAQDPGERIQAAIDAARASGLPAELLESKLAEGLAKNIAMERIAVAVENRARAMERAQAILQRAQRGMPSPADVAVAADAIETGVSDAVLERVAATAGAERRTVAIAALTYLVAEGHASQAALERVEEALARGGQGLGDLQRMSRPAHPHGGPPRGVPPAGRPGHAGPPDGKGSGPPKSPPGG
jgi:hypothetical protein